MFHILGVFTFSFTVAIGVGNLFFKFVKKISQKYMFDYCKRKKSSSPKIKSERREIKSSNSSVHDSSTITEESKAHKLYEENLSEYAVNSLKMENHHYLSCSQKNSSTNSNKIKRLTNEMKNISTSLPIYYSNSIFVRYDESKIDMMKAIIMGADSTPYAHGAYLYDIYFEDTYPTTPPKVNLMTTGGNKIRFNPNLYNNGYVCLSLLGTWSGGKGETWTKESNLLQVLLSIQSLVMTEDVIYNEPSYGSGRNNALYKKQDIGYKNIVKYGNVKYAMIGMLNNPPKGFEEVIKRHFFYKKYDIIRTCDQWVEEAKQQKDADYTGLVSSHNCELSGLFKNKDSFQKELGKEVEELKKILNNLTV